MRFLFFALVDLGQYDEAELALKAYLDMIEIHVRVKGTSADEALSHEQLVRLDVESKYEITITMIAASRLYGKELERPDEALKCANDALDNIHKYLQQHEEAKELFHDAYRCQGIAYGLQGAKSKKSRITLDVAPSKFFPDLNHDAAVTLFQSSTRTRETTRALCQSCRILGQGDSSLPCGV
jgi:tetratricopeptide (TPR) repeat protein